MLDSALDSASTETSAGDSALLTTSASSTMHWQFFSLLERLNVLDIGPSAKRRGAETQPRIICSTRRRFIRAILNESRLQQGKTPCWQGSLCHTFRNFNLRTCEGHSATMALSTILTKKLLPQLKWAAKPTILRKIFCQLQWAF